VRGLFPIILSVCMAPLVAQDPAVPTDARGWINKGAHEFKSARYQDAVESFQKAVDQNPTDTVARVYLATALMSQYIPGADTPDNLALARQAEEQFTRVLDVEPANTTALSSLAALSYQEAQAITDQQQKVRKLDDAASWYEKLIAADPVNKEGYYSLGVIDWQKWYAAWSRARNDLGMRPEQPGPIPNPARQILKRDYSAIVENGLTNLQKALELDPKYSDAMAYVNLLIRERADLADTPEQYRSEVEIADEWVQKALAAKKAEAGVQLAAPLPPPPPPAPAPSGQSPTPQRIRVGGNVQAANLIRKVQPIYPQEAKDQRIQGAVRFTVIIGKDGHIQNMQLVSGHPLLVESARDAVSQWMYKPTLLNGSPVEVVTLVDINFTLRP